MNALRIFGKSWLGAALGIAVYMVGTSFISGVLNVGALISAMVIIGGIFGIASAVVHSFRAPSVGSNIFTGAITAAAILGLMTLQYGTAIIAATFAAYALQMALSLAAMAVMLGLGSYLFMRNHK